MLATKDGMGNLAFDREILGSTSDLGLKTSALRNVDWPRIDAISVDVFDTILLRKPISQRLRYARMAKRVVEALREPAPSLRWKNVFESRMLAERSLFRSTEVFDARAGVRLEDIVAIQIDVLNLSEQDQKVFLDAEMEIEKTCVYANSPLLEDLRKLAETSRPVFAVSDTTWSSRMLKELIQSAAGSLLPLKEVFSSADCGVTKNGGQLFHEVSRLVPLNLQRTLHIGDDVHPDVKMAEAAGATGLHLPRPRAYRALRRASGGVLEFQRTCSGRTVATIPTKELGPTPFGKFVLGPILTELFLSMYTYLRAVDPETRPVALFCARGGLLLRHGFERFLTASELPLAVRRKDFMVSRLVAARAAFLKGGSAADQELSWEFRSEQMRDAATALMGGPVDLPAEWDCPFDLNGFKQLMQTGAASPIHEELREQNQLLEDHIDTICGDARRLILIDTGLYGSTLRLLRDAFPDRLWECVMIARCDYKGHDRSHFPATTGLLVERNGYSPFDRRSSILRYWQMIEDLFEPELPSVRHFHKTPSGTVQSNLEQEGWKAQVSADEASSLYGALYHIDHLTASDLAAVPVRADAAWKLLKRMITFPNEHEARFLGTGTRSRDFGHEGSITPLVPVNGWFPTKASLSRSCWKEGTIATSFGPTRMFWQGVIEIAHALRSQRLSSSRRA